MDLQKRKHKYARIHNNLMSSTTKKFLQKICYKERASIDMTQYGFMRDSKMFIVKLFVKPELENNCDNDLLPKKQEKLEKNKKQRYLKKKKCAAQK